MLDPGSTDSGLLDGLRSFDGPAWARFVEEYSPLVYVCCRRCDLAPEDAADVAQEVFRAVNQSIDRFSHHGPDATFRGWLWTIARNAIRNHVTRTQKGPRAEGGSRIQQFLLAHAEPTEEETLSSVSDPGDVQRLRSAIATVRANMDERTWQCFWAMTVEGESAAEVAERFSMRPSAVRQAKYRVLRRLRSALGRRE